MMLVGAIVFVVLGLGWLEEAERRQRRVEARTQTAARGKAHTASLVGAAKSAP